MPGGAFIRGTGGNAAAVETKQLDSVPNITGNFDPSPGTHAPATKRKQTCYTKWWRTPFLYSLYFFTNIKNISVILFIL
jgi:hypothetical protein